MFEEYETRHCEDLIEMRANNHHRVVKYNFLALQVNVQHEVDAYFCSCHNLAAGKGRPVLPSTDTRLVPEYFCFSPEQRHPYLGTSRVSL